MYNTFKFTSQWFNFNLGTNMNITIEIYSLVLQHNMVISWRKMFITKFLIGRFAMFFTKIMMIMLACLLMVTEKMNIARSGGGSLVWKTHCISQWLILA